MTLDRETVWVTLRERAPPTTPAALLATTMVKPRKRNFDTVGRTHLFARALKVGDWAEAAMMLSAMSTMNSGKLKVSGASEGENRGKAEGFRTRISNGRVCIYMLLRF